MMENGQGDENTVRVLAKVSRGLDMAFWFLEGHLQQ